MGAKTNDLWDGHRVRLLRHHLGLSQMQLAESISVSSSYLSMVENGIRKPSEHLLRLLCLTYGVSKSWLEKGQGEMLLAFAKPAKPENREEQTHYNRERLKEVIHLICNATSKAEKPLLSEGQIDLILDFYEKSEKANLGAASNYQNFFGEMF